MKLVWDPAGIAAIEKRVDRAHDNVVDAVQRDAFRFAPKDTWAMANSIRKRNVARRRSRIIVGGRAAPYWATVEYGSEPHEIRARRKKALHWTGAKHPVRRVWHPGTPAQPFMRRALYVKRVI